MRYERGSVVVAADPFGNTPRRPYLILSDETHPFPGRQYIAVGITTTEYDYSLALADAFVDGELTRESFVSPWAVVSLRGSQIERAVAKLSDSLTDKATQRMAAFVGYGSSDR